MSDRGKYFRQNLLSASTIAVCLAAAAPALAQSTASTAGPGPSPTQAQAGNPEAIVSDVVVTGASRHLAGGLMKAQTAAETMSSITPTAIQEKLTVASPLQLASTIPGVNFGDSDAYGLSVRNFLSVRGLDQTELGFMVEGVPGTDIGTYYPYAETWADNENISDITLTPGNSRLQDPIISASGGEFIESIRAPRDSFGGAVSESIGSFDGWRTFADIDTGYIGNTGAKALLSYSYTSANNYVGPGTNTRDHIDFKLAEDWSPRIHSSLFVSYNYWVDARIPFLSLAQADKGLATNNFDQFAYTSTYNTTSSATATDYYKPLAVHRTNYIIANNNDMELSDRVTLHVTPYFRFTNSDAPGEVAESTTAIYAGNQLGVPVYNPAYLVGGKIITQNNVIFQEYEAGITTNVEADLTATNHLIVGYWHDNWREAEDSYYNQMNLSGAPNGTSKSTALRTTTGALITGTDFVVDTVTDEFFIGDTQSMLDDKLKLSVGFKEMFYTAGGHDGAIGASPAIAAHWTESMPRVLVSYDLNSRTQIYANVTTNARMPVAATTYVTDFSTATGAVSQAANVAQKPEYTIGGQVGFRFNGPLIIDANAFYMHLLDHQLSSLQNINGTLVPTAFTVGNETIKGLSLEVSTHSYAGFSLYGNAQYLNGTFDDNTPVDGTFLPTRGKQMVESPHWVANLGGRYERGPFFAELTAKYVGDQFTTFMNDQTMPGYETVDLSVGYKLPDYKMLKKPVVRLNITNLGNKSYISSDATIATNAVATKGLNGTTIAAGTPLYYIGAPLAAMVTLSTNF